MVYFRKRMRFSFRLTLEGLLGRFGTISDGSQLCGLVRGLICKHIRECVPREHMQLHLGGFAWAILPINQKAGKTWR